MDNKDSSDEHEGGAFESGRQVPAVVSPGGGNESLNSSYLNELSLAKPVEHETSQD